MTENDEWGAEAYLEPDYSDLKEEDFKHAVREYVLSAFKLRATEEDVPSGTEGDEDGGAS